MSRTFTILYTMDSFVLALLTLGHCRIGETISSVAYITEIDGKRIGKIMRPVIDTILFFDPDHCHQSYITFNRITGQTR
jgi:hypothetical protein